MEFETAKALNICPLLYNYIWYHIQNIRKRQTKTNQPKKLSNPKNSTTNKLGEKIPQAMKCSGNFRSSTMEDVSSALDFLLIYLNRCLQESMFISVPLQRPVQHLPVAVAIFLFSVFSLCTFWNWGGNASPGRSDSRLLPVPDCL